jgi:hypothetical protein
MVERSKPFRAMRPNGFLKRIADLEGLEEQLVLAKLTGNFKRGNERTVAKRGG